MIKPSCPLPLAAVSDHTVQPLEARNLQAALWLLEALVAGGVGALVVAPGSRSAPLAQAAALLEAQGLRLLTSIDERSAGFWALGWGKASGRPAAVITTSGTAVANLLPAAVEADWGTVPLLLLSADRPARLKQCGANQTVNQQQFLSPAVRWLGEGDPAGLAAMDQDQLNTLARRALQACRGGAEAPGPVHLNLPFEEPLHCSTSQWQALQTGLGSSLGAADGDDERLQDGLGDSNAPAPRGQQANRALAAAGLDPDQAGVVVAGPWRGQPQHWQDHLQALRRWLARSGWPLLADGLSGLRGQPGLQAVGGYDLVLEQPPAQLQPPQVLRLGPLPASRRLQQWLSATAGPQLLISEGDRRCLDPLGTAACQWSQGLARWCQALPSGLWQGQPSGASLALRQRWTDADQAVQRLLDQQLGPQAPLSEPALARALSRLLPAELPVVLANSSPVRDWESVAATEAAARPVISFRGASGIDGTLSSACGVAEALGQAVLLTGDLALLHDSNGWLWQQQLQGRLAVVLINNGGGGIFEQLPIRHTGSDPGQPSSSLPAMDFERLFAMPQAVDVALLCTAHGVPHRCLEQLQELQQSLAWALGQRLAVLELRTDRRADAALRARLRTMASELVAKR